MSLFHNEGNIIRSHRKWQFQLLDTFFLGQFFALLEQLNLTRKFDISTTLQRFVTYNSCFEISRFTSMVWSPLHHRWIFDDLWITNSPLNYWNGVTKWAECVNAAFHRRIYAIFHSCFYLKTPFVEACTVCWVVTIAIAIIAILLGKVQLHRKMMLRNFYVSLVPMSQRAINTTLCTYTDAWM